MAKDTLDFQHDIACSEGTKDQKCIQLKKLIHEIESMDVYVLSEKFGEPIINLKELYHAYGRKFWIAKADGHFTRYTLVHENEKTNTEHESVIFNQDIYQSILVFKSERRAYVGFITTDESNVFLLIK
jgi:hypothetical protein